MLRRSLLSTVFRNVADAAGGGAVAAAKVEDAAAAAPVVADATAAPAADAAVVVDPAAAAPDAVVVDPAAAAPDAKPAEGASDFTAETLLTGDEPKPGDPPKEAPKAEDKGAEAKPDEAKTGSGDPAVADAAKAAEAPPAPTEAPVYAYEFPEGVTVSDEALKPVNETFAKHGIAPDTAKELMGLHVTEMKKYAESVVSQSAEDQRRVWSETRGQWRDEIRSDEQLGGAGYETTLRQAAEVRDKLVPKDQMAAFNRMLLVTGVGDHPEFLRFLKSAHRYVGEPSSTAQGNPTAHNGQPGGKRRLRDTYTKTA